MTNETQPDGGPAFPVTSDNYANAESAGMTKREYAAIQLKVADSGTDWLDAMIRTAERNELAARAMQGWMANPTATPVEAEIDNSDPQALADVVAVFGYMVADAMQKESNT